MIKKAALSLCVIGASGACVRTRSAKQSGEDPAAAPPAAAGKSHEAVAAVAVEPPLIVREFANSGNNAATAPLHRVTPAMVNAVRKTLRHLGVRRRRIRVDVFPGLA